MMENTGTSKNSSAKPQAILFDWDNTLVNSWPVIHDALNITLTTYGLEPWTLTETKQRVRKSMRDSFPALFGDEWEAAGEVFYDRYEAIHIEKIEPIAHVADMLADFHAQGVYLGVVSNKKGEYLRQEATHLGWDRYFRRLIGALDAPEDKPATSTGCYGPKGQRHNARANRLVCRGCRHRYGMCDKRGLRTGSNTA